MSQVSSTTYVDEFEIFSSLRYDPSLPACANNVTKLVSDDEKCFYMLPYHYDRLLESIPSFSFNSVAPEMQEYERFSLYLIDIVKKYFDNSSLLICPLKVRIAMNQQGIMLEKLDPVPAVPLINLFPPNLNQGVSHADLEWTFYLDTESTPSSIYTTYKTNQREMYNQARERALPPEMPYSSRTEVVLYNADGDITEGSLTSLYFFRGAQWVTPPASTGCQRGTTRRWALEKKLCVEEPVKVHSLKNGERIGVSNGVRGFGIGRLAKYNRKR